jgi:membrane-associated phospholipid phosphatase
MAQDMKNSHYRGKSNTDHGLLMKLIFSCISLIVVVSSANAQTADTLYTKRPLFRATDVLLLGGFTAATIAAGPADRWFTNRIEPGVKEAHRTLDRSATAFRLFGQPGALVAGGGLYVLGLARGNRRVEDLGLHSMESIFLASAITGALKVTAGRARPRISPDNARNFNLFRGFGKDDYESFPSGHATAAFAFASAISAETSHWWPGSRWIVGPAVYGAATLTGVSRIYNNAHWASDVLAGAAIGTFTGIKVFRYQHSHPNNWLDRHFLRAGVTTTANGQLMPVITVMTR